MKLSVSAAKTIHRLQNLKYDECHDLKLNQEIKIVKMTVGLPVGGTSKIVSKMQRLNMSYHTLLI